jgi:hypothetical protein
MVTQRQLGPNVDHAAFIKARLIPMELFNGDFSPWAWLSYF